MGLRINGVVPISGAHVRKLDYYHALEKEHADLVLLNAAEVGLRQVLAGQRVSNDSLLLALADKSSPFTVIPRI